MGLSSFSWPRFTLVYFSLDQERILKAAIRIMIASILNAALCHVWHSELYINYLTMNQLDGSHYYFIL